MRKSTRIVKRLLALFLVVLMSIESFAAVVGDNDGAAFITKAEFESLKNEFNKSLNRYNTSLSERIDGKIAEFLHGLSINKQIELDSLLNKCIKMSANGRDCKFANAYTKPATQKPTSAYRSWLCLHLGGYMGSYSVWESYYPQTVLGRYGTPNSVNNGRRNDNYDSSKNCLICLSAPFDNGFFSISDPQIYNVRYGTSIYGGTHGWAVGQYDKVPTAGTSGVIALDDLRWAGGANKFIDWAEMRGDFAITHNVTTFYNGAAPGEVSFYATFQQYYERSPDTYLNTTTNITDLGYCVNHIASNDKLLVVADDTWHQAKDFNSTSEQSVVMNYCFLPSSSRETAQLPKGEYKLTQGQQKYWNYFHDYKEINIDTLGNKTATIVNGDEGSYVKLNEGLPLFKSDQSGVVTFKIKGTAFITSSSDGRRDVGYNGNWTGSLYISNRRFADNTVSSKYLDSNQIEKTNSWTLSKTNNELVIDCFVHKDEMYWVKFVPTTTTNGLKIQLETESVLLTTES